MGGAGEVTAWESQQPALMCVNNPELVGGALGCHLQLLRQNYKEDLEEES